MSAIPSPAAPAAAAQTGASATAHAARDKAIQKAKTAGVEFESVFLTNVFETMFASLQGDGPLGGEGGAVWRSMLGEEFAKSVASAGGIGIADQVQRELLRYQENQA